MSTTTIQMKRRLTWQIHPPPNISRRGLLGTTERGEQIAEPERRSVSRIKHDPAKVLGFAPRG
jgi:hypothetical protein